MDTSPQRRHEEARELLHDEVREAVGGEAADRAERSGAIDAAIDADRPRTVLGVLSESRALIAITLSVALIVGALVALITGAWWWILVALLLHAIGTVLVVGVALTMTSEVEHADPRTVAALEARGVADPDGALNSAIESAAESGDPDAQAVSEERRAVTPQSPARREEERSRRGEGDR